MLRRACWATFCGLLSCSLLFAGSDVEKLGDGSYLLTKPKLCKPLPDTMYRTANVKGPMVTNQWWSSLVWFKYSQPLFAHPLMVQCTQTGLTITYPGASIKGAAAGIFGANPKDGDLQLSHSAAATFPQADCDGFSDWFVTAAFTAGEANLKASIGHGSPFVFCNIVGGQPVVNFKNTPSIWSGSEKDAVLGITVNGNHYGLFGASGSTWSGIGTQKLTNDSKGKDYFSLAVLPDNKPETLALFKQFAYSHVTDSKIEYLIENGSVKTAYKVTTKQHEGTEAGTLFALYPHQWKYATSPLTAMVYGSVRGQMKVAQGANFTTAVPIQGVLPMLPAEGIADKARMLDYLKVEAEKKPAAFKDTYWEGKHLGMLASLSGIAEISNEPALQKQFVDEIKRRLESWFTATSGKEKPVFYYNATWGTLIGSPSSYGSDSPLNDHHFHYGYFIRAAAEVARVDIEWAKKWAPMVELVIRDIASIDRKDPLFPHMRCFDKYAGHSWASGDANFVDGNNQESSSESLNAWYGMALWGQATHNAALRDAGLFLFNTERTAVEEYWFDVSGTNYPKDFPQVALGMVWGGKGAFGTWFSADIDCIHGINWLPFTPASLYMGRHPNYVKKNFDRIVEKRKGGTDFSTGWGDLVAMFGALNDPAVAVKYMDANPKCKVEDGNTRAFMYHWLHTLEKFGQAEGKITADHPFHTVMRKGDALTYIVYNFDEKPLTVKFSDGKTVQSSGKGLSVHAK